MHDLSFTIIENLVGSTFDFTNHVKSEGVIMIK